MWCQSYRNHVIMAFPSFDTATRLWAPQANISWTVGPVRESEFVRFPKRVISEGEAVACASRAARAWIDQRLRKTRELPRTQDAVEMRSAPIAPARALQSGPAKLARSVKSPGTGRILTFGQFRLLMLRSGVVADNEGLQKSYAALVELRKRNHYSWARIKIKMKQKNMSGSELRGRRMKADRLPLTMRAWQRVI
jgi:hypothetical protein